MLAEQMKDQNDREDARFIDCNVDLNSELKEITQRVMLTFFLVLFMLLIVESCYSQDTHRTYSYKFAVEKVDSRKNAKALLLELRQWALTEHIDFYEECDCFKLTSLSPLQYQDINLFCREKGYFIEPRIMQEDGTVPLPPKDQTESHSPE